MSSKRRAESQITSEDAPDDGDDSNDEKTGNIFDSTWNKADPIELSKRRILKIKGNSSNNLESSSSSVFKFMKVPVVSNSKIETALKVDTNSEIENKDANKSTSTEVVSGFLAYTTNPFSSFPTSSGFPPSKMKGFSLLETNLPSPKSPNPYASQSPKSLFPFVTISANADAPNTYNELTKTASDNNPTDNKGDKDKEDEDKEDEDKEDDEDEKNDEKSKNDCDSTNATAVYTVYQLPENVKVETGEESQECIMQFRAKLFRFIDSSKINNDKDENKDENKDDNKDEKSKNDHSKQSEWREVGIGPIKLLQSTDNIVPSSFSSSRIVMRREDKPGGHGTKLLFNAAISKNTIISKGGDKMIRLTCFNAADTVNNKDKNDLTPAIFMLKTKLSKESDDFYQAINKIIIKQNNE